MIGSAGARSFSHPTVSHIFGYELSHLLDQWEIRTANNSLGYVVGFTTIQSSIALKLEKGRC